MKHFVFLISCFFTCITISAQSGPAISNEGRRHFKAGEAFLSAAVNAEQYLLAAEEFEQVIKTDPSFADTYFNLGKIYTRIGKEKGIDYFKKAEDCFKKCLTLNPSDSAIVEDELYVLNSFKKQFANDSKMDSDIEYFVYRDTTITIDGKDYDLVLSGPVDLGLSVQWAAYNVGANEPNDMGKVFAWGETSMKSRYGKTRGNDNNYRFYSSLSDIYTKYNEYYELGDVDGLTKLRPEDDAATQNMGRSWRMPTIDEFDELLDNNRYWLYELRGKLGMLICSSKTQKALFLPTTGFYSDSKNYRRGDYIWGYYWSSDLWRDNSRRALGLIFKCYGFEEGENDYFVRVSTSTDLPRESGFAVRAVLKAKGGN